MVGDEKRRHCTRCDKQVLNLSMMTEAEARKALFGKGPMPCTRALVNAEGLVKLLPTRSRPRELAAGAALTLALASSLTARADATIPPPSEDIGEFLDSLGQKPDQTKTSKASKPPKPAKAPKSPRSAKGDAEQSTEGEWVTNDGMNLMGSETVWVRHKKPKKR